MNQIQQGYCLYILDNLCDTVYHNYITAHKVLSIDIEEKNILLHKDVFTQPHRSIIYLLHKNSRSINMYYFSQ